jgi:hypothetical protein
MWLSFRDGQLRSYCLDSDLRGRLSVAARPRVLLVCVLCATLGGCYAVRPSDGGGMTAFEPPRRFEPADVALPEGYRMELVAEGLTFPTDVTFDDGGGVYVTEAGYSYGEMFLTPRLVKIESAGRPVEVARGDDNGPWTGATWRDGAFYIAEGGELRGGRILRIDPGGRRGFWSTTSPAPATTRRTAWPSARTAGSTSPSAPLPTAPWSGRTITISAG